MAPRPPPPMSARTDRAVSRPHTARYHRQVAPRRPVSAKPKHVTFSEHAFHPHGGGHGDAAGRRPPRSLVMRGRKLTRPSKKKKKKTNPRAKLRAVNLAASLMQRARTGVVTAADDNAAAAAAAAEPLSVTPRTFVRASSQQQRQKQQQQRRQQQLAHRPPLHLLQHGAVTARTAAATSSARPNKGARPHTARLQSRALSPPNRQDALRERQSGAIAKTRAHDAVSRQLPLTSTAPPPVQRVGSTANTERVPQVPATRRTTRPATARPPSVAPQMGQRDVGKQTRGQFANTAHAQRQSSIAQRRPAGRVPPMADSSTGLQRRIDSLAAQCDELGSRIDEDMGQAEAATGEVVTSRRPV